ncbi:MAG: PaaI family thioesterase [Actinomycetota bacterium]
MDAPSPIPTEIPTAERLDAAASVRRLVDALVGHVGDPDALAEVARTAASLADRLEEGPRRVRDTGRMLRYDAPVPEGGELSCWPECSVSGVAHGASSGISGRRDGDEAVLTATLGPAKEGLPGVVHGGAVASLFDESMGWALWMDTVPSVTAWLRVDYRAPVPSGVEVEIRATARERDGRKIMMEAKATVDGALVAEAEGLFIVPRAFGES